MAKGPVYGKLSNAQIEVLRLAAAGKNRQEMAALRGTKPKTIDGQLEMIQARMGTKDWKEALRRAKESGQL